MTTAASTLAHEVRAGYARGWSFVPLSGKVPVQKGWTDRPRETLEEAIAWAEAGNVGVRTGKASGVYVVDLDVEKGADPEFLDNVVTVTAARGNNRHLYFKMPPGMTLSNSAGKLGPHIDFGALARLERVEAAERATLQQIVANLPGVHQ